MVVGVLLGVSTSTAQAASFAENDLTPAGAGVANAVVAGTGSISDALYNPAALAWQEGVQAIFSNKSRYKNNNVNIAGVSYEGDLNLGTRNAFAISWLPHGGNLGIAASLATPYNAQLDWGAAFPTLGGIELNMRRYSSDVFWRVNNTLGVAAGLDIYRTDLSLNGGSSFSGSDWSDIGAHVGVRWEVIPFWTLGAHYRQGVAASVRNTAGDVSVVQLPDELTLGLAHSLLDDEMLLELDIKHSTWSSLKDLSVSASNGASLQSHAANLRDTTDAMLGLTWFWRNDTQLRFGYAYEQGANQTAGYQPLLSDASGHKVTLGFGGMMATMHLDVTWTGTRYNKVDAVGAYAGRYTDARYSFMFSLSKKF